ncbi:MAG: chemotaxis response regulator protein-glutamate methylesterase [Synergistales bacterium]|nr:chemotaxis response regulator protein-glutamate methylesterase [Synergistales bacterium]
MNPIRVLVVDDSAFMRKIIGDILGGDDRITVIDKARDGEQALEKIKALRPDVVTLDVEMPKRDGLQVLESVMRDRPTPVIMVSSLTHKGADITMKALAAGAVDFVPKPSGTISLDMNKVADELRGKVIAAAGVQVSTLSSVLVREPKPSPPEIRPPAVPKKRKVTLLVMAASTGGPRALQRVLPDLPEDFPVPVAIVQHMPRDFTVSFARRLDSLCSLQVRLAEEGMEVGPGTAVVAPGGSHLMIERGVGGRMRCLLSDGPPLHSVKPAADILFVSAADVYGDGTVGVILTGMGRDGTKGALAIRKRGGYVFSESSETAVVYGMPRSAAEAGAADRQLPLQEIGPSLRELVGVAGKNSEVGGRG